MTDAYSIVDFGETANRSRSEKSDTERVDLTDHLGLRELRSRVWFLQPGDRLNYHVQGEQEELYVPLKGPAQIRLGDDVRTVPEGTAIRVPPDTPRQLRNDSEDVQEWLVVGAPPVPGDGQPLET